MYNVYVDVCVCVNADHRRRCVCAVRWKICTNICAMYIFNIVYDIMLYIHRYVLRAMCCIHGCIAAGESALSLTIHRFADVICSGSYARRWCSQHDAALHVSADCFCMYWYFDFLFYASYESIVCVYARRGLHIYVIYACIFISLYTGTIYIYIRLCTRRQTKTISYACEMWIL